MTAAEVKKCAEEGITVYLSKPQTSANRKQGLFTKEDFRYNPKKDCLSIVKISSCLILLAFSRGGSNSIPLSVAFF
jgi:hypothetical protein